MTVFRRGIHSVRINQNKRAAMGGSFILIYPARYSSIWYIQKDKQGFNNHFAWKGLANPGEKW